MLKNFENFQENHFLDQQIKQPTTTLHTHRTKNNLKLHPVKKFGVGLVCGLPFVILW